MDRCPPDALLRALLAAALPPESRGVEAHVNGCSDCQGRLEGLTADPLADRLRAAAPAAGERPSLLASTFLNRMRGHGSAGETAPREAAAAAGWPELPGYRILDELGRGGIGVVYKALDVRLNRTVAVKMLLGGPARDDTRVRFLIEAEAVARLRHRGIVQVFEFGDAHGSPFLAMEFVPGGTLARRLATDSRFAPRQAAAILLDLAVAVAAAHRAGVIHRDLKPANILIEDRPDDAGSGSGTDDPATPELGLGFRPKIADFGLARIDGTEMTLTGTVMGTPAYMAPEQAAGDVRRIDTRSDVYSLGAVFYELLTGQPPFAGSSALDILQQVVHVEPRSPRSLAGGVPRDLDVICRKCLAKGPDRRYPTADALAADLKAYLTGRPISARPMSLWERSARYARRHPWPAAAAFALVFLAVASFLLVNAARVGERVARKAADDREQVALKARAAEADARARAERREALIAFDRAILRCESGDIVGGVEELKEAVAAADRAGDRDLARVAGQNLGAWRERLPVLVRRYHQDAGHPTNAVEFGGGGELAVLADGMTGAVRAWPLPPAEAERPVYELPPVRTLLNSPYPTGLAPAADGSLVIGYQSGTLRPFDSRTGRLTGAAVELPLLRELRDFAVHARRGWLAYGTDDGSVRVVDAASGKAVHSAPLIHRNPTGRSDPPEFDPKTATNPLTAVAFADNGQFVLGAARRGGVLMWGLPSGKCLHQFDFGTEVFRLAVSGDGQFFLAGGETATSLWSIHNRTRPLWVHKHPRRSGAVAFSADGQVCAAADHAGNVACLDRDTGRPVARLRHSDGVRAIAFHPVQPLLLVAGDDGVVDLWRLPLREDRIVAVPAAPAAAAPWDTVPIGSPSHRTVSAVGFWPGSADLWSVSPNGIKRWTGVEPPFIPAGDRLPPGQGRRGLRSGAVDATGKLAVAGGWDSGSTGVWDLSGPAPAFHPLGVGAAAVGILSDGRSVFTVTEELAGKGCLRWWTLRNGKPVPDRSGWPALSYPLTIAPHPDGKTVLVGQKHGQPTGLRDAHTGALVLELPHPDTVTAAVVHPAGTFAATGGRDGSVRVWSLPDGRPVGRPFFHADRVNQIAFGTGIAEGAVVTVSHDRTGRAWDFRLGLPLGPPLEHPEAVLAVALAPDGRLITGGKDGVVRLWRAAWLGSPPVDGR